MANEEIEQQVEEVETPEEALNDDTTDWKAEAIKARRMAKQAAKKLEKATAPKADTPAPQQEQPKSSDLDYGQKAYLAAFGIKGSDELALVKTWLNRTGDELDVLVDDEIFQSKLKSLREAKATKDATPSSSKRSNTATRDTVDYWLAKGELPPNTPENRQLRIDVVKAKTKAASDNNIFTDTPVVS